MRLLSVAPNQRCWRSVVHPPFSWLSVASLRCCADGAAQWFLGLRQTFPCAALFLAQDERGVHFLSYKVLNFAAVTPATLDESSPFASCVQRHQPPSPPLFAVIFCALGHHHLRQCAFVSHPHFVQPTRRSRFQPPLSDDGAVGVPCSLWPAASAGIECSQWHLGCSWRVASRSRSC